MYFVQLVVLLFDVPDVFFRDIGIDTPCKFDFITLY